MQLNKVNAGSLRFWCGYPGYGNFSKGNARCSASLASQKMFSQTLENSSGTQPMDMGRYLMFSSINPTTLFAPMRNYRSIFFSEKKSSYMYM